MKEAKILHLTVGLSVLRSPALNESPMVRRVVNKNSHLLRYLHRLLTTPLFCFNSSLLIQLSQLLAQHGHVIMLLQSQQSTAVSSASYSRGLSSLVLQLPGFVVNASTVISMDIASQSAANVWHEKPLLVSSLNLSVVKHLLLTT